jgi:acylphosphatase
MSVVTEREIGEMIQVRGLVQGVGFRPTVWRLARAHGLRGSVANDGEGVTIHVCGRPAKIADFVDGLLSEPPPLARIERLERAPAEPVPPETGSGIASSRATTIRTGIVPDAVPIAARKSSIRVPGVIATLSPTVPIAGRGSRSLRPSRTIAASMKQMADLTGVKIVTGDTKVVERGAADKMFVNTAGIGVVSAGVSLSAKDARPGDVVIVNGDHGTAILIARNQLALEADIASDRQPLDGLVAAMLASYRNIAVCVTPRVAVWRRC